MTPAPVQTRLSGQQTQLLILLVASVFINYIDRGSLAVAAAPLQKDLHLSGTQLGSLHSAFFFTYAFGQLLAGWLVDRYNVYWVFAAGFLLWSGATGATGFIAGFAALFAARLVLGIGEAVAYPAYSKMLAADMPEFHRGLANALIDAGSKLGPALGTFAGGMLIASYGWRPFFIVLGIGGLLWLIPWCLSIPKTSNALSANHRDGPSVKRILQERSAWGTFGGLFCCNYFWYIMISWLPWYLINIRGFSMEKMAKVGATAYIVIAVVCVIAGYTSDRLIARGISSTKVRKSFACIGLGGASIILPVAMVKDEFTAIALLMCACASFGLFTSNSWAITQTIAGPLAAGKWTGLQNCIGNFAGITAPFITGLLYDKTHSFVPAFAVAAVILCCGVLLYAFVVGPVRPLIWGPITNRPQVGNLPYIDRI